jgi:predicted TIM-barrel fold metal-dependent hydrolase
MWREYLPAAFRERAPRLESTDEGDFEVFEGRRKPIMVLNSLAGKKPEEYSLTVRRLDETRAGGWDPAARLEDMDLDGVAAEVLYGGGPLNSADPELRLASHAAYNDWLADFCAVAPDRLIGVAYIPFGSMEGTPTEIKVSSGSTSAGGSASFGSVEGAVAEIERAHRRGLKSVLIPAEPPFGEWHGPEWAPLWRTLSELQMPAAFHVGFSFAGKRQTSLDSGSYFLTHLVMSKLGMAAPLVQLAYSGVLEAYPGLKVVAVEGQLGWIPFVVQYVDHLYEKHRHWTKLDLKERPSYYLRRQVYATFMEDEVGLRERHALGVDNIMWSSDYPHSETTWPNSRQLVEQWLAELTPEETRKIVRDNARSLYGLDR